MRNRSRDALEHFWTINGHISSSKIINNIQIHSTVDDSVVDRGT